MASFDLYTYKYTESEGFFRRGAEKEATVWLDGIDGFYDHYFSRLQGIEKDEIRFVPIEMPSSIPSEPAEFEKLPIVDAKIIENNDLKAQVSIRDVQSLGQWARALEIPSYETLSSIPQNLLPPGEVVTELRERAAGSGTALWGSGARYWKKPSEVSAIYMFTHQERRRCLVLTTNAVPSYAVLVD